MFCILPVATSGLVGGLVVGATIEELEDEADPVALAVLALLLLLLLLFRFALAEVVDEDFFSAARVAANDEEVDDDDDEEPPFRAAVDIAAFSFCSVA